MQFRKVFRNPGPKSEISVWRIGTSYSLTCKFSGVWEKWGGQGFGAHIGNMKIGTTLRQVPGRDSTSISQISTNFL